MKFLFFTFLIYGTFLQNSFATPEEIKLCYEDVTVYPWITGDKKGLAISELQLVEKNLNLKFKYIRLPWKRCQSQARAGLVDGIIAASFNKKRAEWGTYPIEANDKLERDYRLHTDSFYVYVRKDGHIAWKNANFQNIGNNPVGVQLGYSVGSDVKAAGYQTESSFMTPYDLLKALDMGMVKVAILQNHAAQKTLQEHPNLAKNIERQEEPFKIADQYVLFNTNFFKSNRELCVKIWKAISVARNSHEYQKNEQVFLNSIKPKKTSSTNL